jgi:DNA-binding transcriptional LysR family regulator
MHVMHLSQFDLNLLLVLHALFEAGSVEAAAARVHLSRSAFSHALARAREAVGDPIAVKVGRRLELTPRGRALRDPVRQAIDAVGRAFTPPQRFDPRGAERVFRLAATDYTLSLLLPRMFARKSRELPHIRLRTQALGLGGDVDQVVSGDLDAAIGVFPTLPSGIEQLVLFEDDFVCLLADAHPLAKKRRLTLAKYAGARHLLVAPRTAARSHIDTLLEELGHARKVALTIPSFLMVPRILGASDLIATVSVRLAADFTARWPLCALPLPLPHSQFAITLVWHRRLSADPAHRWLRAWVAAAAEDLGPLPSGRPARVKRPP